MSIILPVFPMIRLVMAAANVRCQRRRTDSLNAPSVPVQYSFFIYGMYLESRSRIIINLQTLFVFYKTESSNDGNNRNRRDGSPLKDCIIDGEVRMIVDDGTQANNYFLASDANGVGTWKPVVIQSISGYNCGAEERLLQYN